MIYVGGYIHTKAARKLFGQVWGNSGKNLPKIVPASTPMNPPV